MSSSTYRIRIYGYDDDAESMGTAPRAAAERRFRTALEATLGGDASLVLPMHTAYQRLVALYGDAPGEGVLSDDEQLVFDQWQAAEKAAITAALGPERQWDEAIFEISAG